MRLVVDCSTVLAWAFEDEYDPVAEAALDAITSNGAIAPSHWRAEIANGMQMAIRRNRIDSEYRDVILAEIGDLPVELDMVGIELVWTDAIGISDRFSLTVYDAMYLELASRRDLPLATLDRRLAKAAQSAGVALFEGPLT